MNFPVGLSFPYYSPFTKTYKRIEELLAEAGRLSQESTRLADESRRLVTEAQRLLDAMEEVAG